MAQEYVDVVRQQRRVIDAVERWLSSTSPSGPISAGALRSIPIDGLITEEQFRAALGGLAALGALAPEGRGSFRAVLPVLEKTTDYRRGVRDALDGLPKPEVAPEICVAVPRGLPTEQANVVRLLGVDLRAAVFDLVASASRRVVLASPFWDDETARELADALAPRLRAGVRVDLLGRRLRSADGVETGLQFLRARLHRQGDARFFLWREPDGSDRFGSTTFHFKAAVADDGVRAYLGSANFTTSGLRSRMELGVILEGASATRLAAIIDVALCEARETRRRTG